MPVRHTQTMAPKGHRSQLSGGPLRHHSRTSSGGSSKVALHLQLTAQKDPNQPKHLEKNKKSTIPHETHPHASSPHPKTHHGRAHVIEHTHPPKRLQHQQSTKHNGIKTKADFTIASPGTDEEEWVSSESGAVTPNNDAKSDDDDDDDTDTLVKLHDPPHAITSQREDSAWPDQHLYHRAETLVRVETLRPSVNELARPPPPSPPPSTTEYHIPAIEHSPPDSDPTDTTAHHHHHHHLRHNHTSHNNQRQSSTRPSSTYSSASRSESILRPHPLIRGPSFMSSHNYIPKPTPLAPLTVTDDASPTGTPSSSPTEHHLTNGPISSSPLSTSTTPVSPVSPHNRRTSVSSTRSSSTLPMPIAPSHQTKLMYDRHRTLSTLSSSSTTSNSPALSSLTHLPTHSRPLTPQMVAYFPVLNPHINLEAIHPLLPAPYLNTHLTVLAYRTPIRESFDRVIHAKLAAR